MYYSIEETLKGYDVTLFIDHDEYSFTASSWEEVVEYFTTEWNIAPQKPITEEIATPDLAYNPFVNLLGGE